MTDQEHNWRVVQERKFSHGWVQTERCDKCNAIRIVQYPPGMKLDTEPKPLPRFCPGMQTEPNPFIRQQIRYISRELTEAEVERLEKDNGFVTNLLECERTKVYLMGGLEIHMTFPDKANMRFKVR